MAEEESTEINEEEEHLPSAEESSGEEESEEYVFEDEEPLPAGTLDVKALEIMVAISELLNEALTKNLDPKEVAEKIKRLQAKLKSVRRRKRKQPKQTQHKASKTRKSRR